LNNQIYKLEEQITHLQKKLNDINNYNINCKKNKMKIKEYELIIQNEKIKNEKAEKIIYIKKNKKKSKLSKN
jgi:hypothetical protein